MSDFLTAVTAAFRNVIDRGLLAVASDHYDSKAFGNAVVVLAGGNVFIRLVRDRGDIFADAASAKAPEDWAPLERVLAAVGISGVPEEGLLSPIDAAHLVEENFPALDAGLSPNRLDETRARLADMKRFKMAAAMHRLQGK